MLFTMGDGRIKPGHDRNGIVPRTRNYRPRLTVKSATSIRA
jgi:hypothetical protein